MILAISELRSQLISELSDYTLEIYEDEPENTDMAGAHAHWCSLSLHDLKVEHRSVKVRCEIYRAAKSARGAK
jgi:hypothetical protein